MEHNITREHLEELKTTIWILTTEFNLYDQHGAYFVAAWNEKPTANQLAAVLKDGGFSEQIGLVEHVLAGGGRQGIEHQWFNLEEFEEGSRRNGCI